VNEPNSEPRGPDGPACNLCGWIKLWHPKGVLVTLPVPCPQSEGLVDYLYAFGAVNSAFAAGFLAQAPGLEEGELKEDVGWIVKAFTKEGKTKLLLYAANDKLTWSFLVAYMDTDQQVAEFEYASKIKLDSLPDYIGQDKPQRGANKMVEKFFVQAPRPFTAIYKNNPKYREAPAGEDSRSILEKTKHHFVRWADQKPTANEPSEPVTLAGKPLPANSGIQQERDKLADFLKTNPLLDEINQKAVPYLRRVRARDTSAFDCCWPALTDYCSQNGWRCDREKWLFVTTAQRKAEIDASLAKATENMEKTLAKTPPAEHLPY
jgi:hypothetical protein